MSAQGFYNELLKTKKDKVTDAITYLITILTILPYIEIIIGLAVMIIANIIGYGDSIVASSPNTFLTISKTSFSIMKI